MNSHQPPAGAPYPNAEVVLRMIARAKAWAREEALKLEHTQALQMRGQAGRGGKHKKRTIHSIPKESL
jgi:hypothetical protein